MRTLRNLLILPILVGIMGYVPSCVTSRSPLTDPGTGPVDLAIVGTWVELGDQREFLHVGIDESGLLEVVYIYQSERGDQDTPQTGNTYLLLSGHNSLVGGNWYVNLLREGCLGDCEGFYDDMPLWNSQMCGYLILKYRVENDVLALSFMDSDFVEDAIYDGKLDALDTGADICIRTEQEALQEFVTRYDSQLFGEDRNSEGWAHFVRANVEPLLSSP